MRLAALTALLYVISPLDFVPEAFMPIVAWLDDVGLVLFVRIVLNRVLAKYRYPLFQDPPVPAADRPSGAQFASG